MANLTHMQQKVYDYIVSCIQTQGYPPSVRAVSYKHIRANETEADLVCRLML